MPMREEIIFPKMIRPFIVGRKASMEALEAALAADRRIFVVSQRTVKIENPEPSDLYTIGVLGKVLQVMRLPNGTVKALFEGEQRAKVIETHLGERDYMAHVLPVVEPEEQTPEYMQKIEETEALFHSYIKHVKQKVRSDVLKTIKNATPSQVSDVIIPLIDVDREIKQELLECLDPYERLNRLYDVLAKELEIHNLESELQQKASEEITGEQRKTYLQNHLQNVQKELGRDDSKSEMEALNQKIKDAKMPHEAEEVAQKELKKLRLMSALSSEANVVHNYLEWLISMPWQELTEDNFDLKRAQDILEEDHYGLKDVKERIIEYLAVARLKGELKTPIICLVGPPGVGKTSLAKSVARALDRKYIRMSLGGVRDEASIRGHRRTYIGAMPGKIIQSIRKAKSNNPVLLIDEIDKLYQSAASDPSAAMLEVLDPEQNTTFVDHYLEVEYDLSKVLFLCTANTTQHIPAPLLDRMELISLSSYTELEKHHIANRFLIPRQRKAHGLEDSQLHFQKPALQELIANYTREAGVRNLEREIGKVCRKVVTKLIRTQTKKVEEPQSETQKAKPKASKIKKAAKNVIVTPKLLRELLGVVPHQHQHKEEKSEVGVAMGLSVTSLGGELLLVEVSLMKGSGKLLLTGKLGDVLQESAKAAYSYVRSNAEKLGINFEAFNKNDLHIHLPEGAVPKDGPSAGLPLISAIISVFTETPVKNEVAMTGEITLCGQVTQIGGLKEKLLAAKRALIPTVVIPEENKKDLSEIPNEILKGLEVLPVTKINEAIEIALEPFPKMSIPSTETLGHVSGSIQCANMTNH